MTSNAVPPSVTPPSPNEWLGTVYPITGITNDSVAKVTCSAYSFTSADENVTSITFKQVVGMIPINGITCRIRQVINSTQFLVDVDTTNFPIYRSGGVICIDTGQPPVQQQGFQYFNTPWQNVATTN